MGGLLKAEEDNLTPRAPDQAEEAPLLSVALAFTW